MLTRDLLSNIVTRTIVNVGEIIYLVVNFVPAYSAIMIWGPGAMVVKRRSHVDVHPDVSNGVCAQKWGFLVPTSHHANVWDAKIQVEHLLTQQINSS